VFNNGCSVTDLKLFKGVEMIKVKAFWTSCILLTIVVCSCHKDLGNYSYHDINSLTVKLDSSYSGMYGQRFTVKPEIRITMDKSENLDDTSKYGFEWYVIDPAFIPVTSAKVVLSTQHILDTVLTLRPGANYTLNCKITDKKTGVKWAGTALLTVTTSILLSVR
jgi:hypothetical protein